MEAVLKKYKSLSPEDQQQANDFINFLVAKKKRSKFDMKNWKKKIMSISVWTSEDVKKINNGLVKSWKTPEW